VPYHKKPRTTDQPDDTNQTTLTQIWMPTRKTYHKPTQGVQDEDIDKDFTNETEPTPDHITIIYNPYTGTRTPMITPQKQRPNDTNTKPKSRNTTPQTNLKDPPPHSLSNITQTNTNDAPSQELADMVQNTERLMDQATAEFHQADKETTRQGHPTGSGSLVIDGIGSPFRATNPEAMNSLIKYIDDLQEKYRRIIKEYEETKASHEAAFKETLIAIALRYEKQARQNMEHIITSQSSQAESDFKSLLRGITKPQANNITNQIMAKLKSDTSQYTQKLEKDYFDKQAEMISDLDHYHDKASEVLKEAMDDFYHYTVPITIPPKLTEYLDQHLEERVATIVKTKLDDIFDKRMTDTMETQLETLLEARYGTFIDNAIQARLQQTDTVQQLQQFCETIQQAKDIRTEIYNMQCEGHTEAL
jgi:hypothetical protein